MMIPPKYVTETLVALNSQMRFNWRGNTCIAEIVEDGTGNVWKTSLDATSEQTAKILNGVTDPSMATNERVAAELAIAAANPSDRPKTVAEIAAESEAKDEEITALKSRLAEVSEPKTIPGTLDDARSSPPPSIDVTPTVTKETLIALLTDEGIECDGRWSFNKLKALARTHNLEI